MRRIFERQAEEVVERWDVQLQERVVLVSNWSCLQLPLLSARYCLALALWKAARSCSKKPLTMTSSMFVMVDLEFNLRERSLATLLMDVPINANCTKHGLMNGDE